MRVLALSLAIGALAPGFASADVLEEVIVTSTLRQQPLTEVPRGRKRMGCWALGCWPERKNAGFVFLPADQRPAALRHHSAMQRRGDASCMTSWPTVESAAPKGWP